MDSCSLYQSLDAEQKSQVIVTALRICAQVATGFALPSPYYLVLDNDVLNALQKPEQTIVRNVVLSIFFEFIRQTEEKVTIVVTPLTLKEFSLEDPFTSEAFFKKAMEGIDSVVKATSFEPLYLGLASFKEAQSYNKSLLHDIGILHNAIVNIKNKYKKTTVDLKVGTATKFPHVAATEIAPSLDMKYFQKDYANYVIRSLIEHLIIINPQTDRYARSHMKSEDAANIANLLTIKKNRLKGAGDLGMLSMCDIGYQFFKNKNMSVIGLTFDQKLEKGLKSLSKIYISSDEIVIGVDSVETASAKLHALYKDGVALDHALTKGERLAQTFCRFLQDNGFQAKT